MRLSTYCGNLELEKPLDFQIMTTSKSMFSMPPSRVAPAKLASPLNREALASRCLGDSNFARSIVDQFILSFPEGIEKFKKYLASDDLESLAKEAHRWKGTAGMLSAEPLTKLMVTVEVEAEGKNKNRIQALIQKMESEFRRLEVYVAQTLHNEKTE